MRGKPANTFDQILRPRRAKRVDISFFFNFHHFYPIERTTNFSRGEKRALEDQLIAPQLIEKSRANLLHVSTEHTKIKRTNQTLMYREKRIAKKSVTEPEEKEKLRFLLF